MRRKRNLQPRKAEAYENAAERMDDVHWQQYRNMLTQLLANPEQLEIRGMIADLLEDAFGDTPRTVKMAAAWRDTLTDPCVLCIMLPPPRTNVVDFYVFVTVWLRFTSPRRAPHWYDFWRSEREGEGKDIRTVGSVCVQHLLFQSLCNNILKGVPRGGLLTYENGEWTYDPMPPASEKWFGLVVDPQD